MYREILMIDRAFFQYRKPLKGLFPNHIPPEKVLRQFSDRRRVREFKIVIDPSHR